MPGLDRAAAPPAWGSAALDRRLEPAGAAPLAVAFSGGADSLLLLLAATAWAGRHGRAVLALTVDHRLQPASAGWTRDCAAVAERLGAGFRALAWDGPKPKAGLPAAARSARHRLLAEAAREAGARVILLGHTASDIAEGELMRAEGANIGRLREWSPSPIWPEGRGLFCLRPLLDLTRDMVREHLAADGWGWIDDPANEDQRFGRPRARRALQGSARRPNRGDDRVGRQAAGVRFGPDGSAFISRALAADPGFARLLQVTLLCVCGGQTPARTAKVEALVERLRAPAAFTAALGGCRIVADDCGMIIAREAGEARRGRMQPLDLIAGQAVVWDGRFELVTGRPGLIVRALEGLAPRLPEAERRKLTALPAPARPALPAIIGDGGQTVTCPILAEASEVRAQALAAGRWLAACGLIAHEAAADRLAHGGFTFDVLSWTRETEKGRSE